MAKRKYHQLIICLFAVLMIFSLSGCAEINELNTGGYWEKRYAARQTASDQRGVSIINSAPATMSTTGFENLPPVKVAILLPLSGPQANVGQAMLQSAQLALFDIGYNNFELIPRDTAGTTSGAKNAANAAINDGAQIILGPLFANSVRAVKSVAQPRGINVIAFSTDWTLADSSTYIMGFMPATQVNRVTQYATQSGYKNFAVIAPNDKYGNLVTSQFEKQARASGASINNMIRFKPGDPDVINEIAKLKGGNFQAVFMPVGGSQTEMISSALSYNKLMPNQIKRIGTGLWDDPRIADQANMQGAWFAAPSPNARRSFESKYVSTYGQKPPRLATLAYDATALTATLAKNGFDKNGVPAFNSMAITNEVGFAGVDGVFRFNSNGLIERALAVLEIRNGQIIEVSPAANGF